MLARFFSYVNAGCKSSKPGVTTGATSISCWRCGKMPACLQQLSIVSSDTSHRFSQMYGEQLIDCEEVIACVFALFKLMCEKGDCLNLMEGEEFVDLDGGAAGFDVSMGEIFDLVAASNMGNEQSTELLENDRGESGAAEETKEVVSFIEIYQRLLGVEWFWRDNDAANAAFHITKDVRTLLWNTLSFLQKGITDDKTQTCISDFFLPVKSMLSRVFSKLSSNPVNSIYLCIV